MPTLWKLEFGKFFTSGQSIDIWKKVLKKQRLFDAKHKKLMLQLQKFTLRTFKLKNRSARVEDNGALKFLLKGNNGTIMNHVVHALKFG